MIDDIIKEFYQTLEDNNSEISQAFINSTGTPFAEFIENGGTMFEALDIIEKYMREKAIKTGKFERW